MAAWTWLLASGDYGLTRYLEDPAMDGEPILLSLVDIRAKDQGTYDVDDGTFEFRVRGRTEAELGEAVTVGGTWRAQEQVVEAAWVERHPHRWAKRWLAIVALAGVLFASPWWFRIEPDGVVTRG